MVIKEEENGKYEGSMDDEINYIIIIIRIIQRSTRISNTDWGYGREPHAI